MKTTPITDKELAQNPLRNIGSEIEVQVKQDKPDRPVVRCITTRQPPGYQGYNKGGCAEHQRPFHHAQVSEKKQRKKRMKGKEKAKNCGHPVDRIMPQAFYDEPQFTPSKEPHISRDNQKDDLVEKAVVK